MAKTHLTAGQLRDLLERAWSVIVESEGADEHTELLTELHETLTLVREEIGGSHMGSGAGVVILGEEVGDGR